MIGPLNNFFVILQHFYFSVTAPNHVTKMHQNHKEIVMASIDAIARVFLINVFFFLTALTLLSITWFRFFNAENDKDICEIFAPLLNLM